MTEITANHNALIDTKDFTFHFKKDKLGNKRPSVELKLAVPSVEGIVAILEKGGKELELLQDAMYDVIRSQAAGIVSDDEKASQTTVDFSKLSWEAIANMPKADRRSSSIAPELWEAFAKDYIEVMPGVTGKSQEAVTNATVVYLKKFSIVKTNKDVLGKLKEQLGLYLEHSKNAEQFGEILELLVSKVDSFLTANDVELLVSNL
jgi:glycerol-3-phosphate responsive antiterminator